MTRALDGTFWRVRDCWKGHNHTYECYVRVDRDDDLITFRDYDEKPTRIPPDSKLVRVRPRMSIVRAVKLLTEAREKGVELWMRSAIRDGGWVVLGDESEEGMYTFGVQCAGCGECDSKGKRSGLPILTDHIQQKWIVATPEDARRIDAKRGGK